MLAGLLFAVHDAEDRLDRLAATLPFAGTTLIEYQARLLMDAGASQIVVVAARLTPDLLGAISRIARRGVTVDAVRGADEAADKLHPLSRVLVLADGLVTDEATIAPLAIEGGDALLVVGEDDASAADELIGGRLAWAGVARLGHARLRDVAAMPRDYDLQSALLRVASQTGAAHVPLPATAKGGGHGVERRADTIEARGRAMLSATMAGARSWFDRWIIAPVGRFALPALVTRGVPAAALAACGALLGLGGLAAVRFDLSSTGLALILAAVIVWRLGGMLAGLRDERRLARMQSATGALLPAAAALLLAARLSRWSGEATALAVAMALVTVGGLAERAVVGRERLASWGDPGAYILLLLLASVSGAPLAGLALAAIYAAVTLGFVIEALRRHA